MEFKKQTSKQNKTHRYREQIGGYQKGKWFGSGEKRVKGVNYMVIDG